MISKAGDYSIPLMKLLDEFQGKSDATADVIRFFGDTFISTMDPQQLTINSSGQIRWVQNVYTACSRLKNIGFIDVPTFGIWRLSDAGHQWLMEHPNATGLSFKTNGEPIENPTDRIISPPVRRHKIISSELLSQSEFFLGIQNSLELHLQDKTFLELPSHRFRHWGNILQIKVEGFSGCHYEFVLHRNDHEIALHFEGSQTTNVLRISAFEPLLENLGQKVGYPLQSGPFESGGKLRLWIEQPVCALIEENIGRYANLMAHLIKETFPILLLLYQSNPQKRQRSSSNSQIRNMSGPVKNEYLMLEREIEAIKGFLQGRTYSRPNDEKICDWVNLCYLIGLYHEGNDLFMLVSQENIHPWYYEKTKKLARLCLLKIS